MMRHIRKLVAGAALMAAAAANSSPVNVGGFIFDPDSIFDFSSSGSVLENAFGGVSGPFVFGRGEITSVNNTGSATFCPSCEVTFTFSMVLAAPPVPLGGGNFSFAFTLLDAKIFVDSTPDYDVGSLATSTAAQASDGALLLHLAAAGPLTGIGTNLGTGSDAGTGEMFLNVIGGLAAGNFDTNGKLGGTDFKFSSSFQPFSIPQIDPDTGAALLFGDIQLTGNSIPEPGTLALLGFSLFGLRLASRRR